METTIQSTVTPTLRIEVQARDNEPVKVWVLCVDYRAMAKVEAETGIDMKDPACWVKMKSGADFPKIIWCCLARYSPDVTLNEVMDGLNPQAHALLWNALYDITFPGLREAYREAKKAGNDPKPAPAVKTT